MKRLFLMLSLTIPCALVGCDDGDEAGTSAPSGATVFTLGPNGGTFEGEGPLAGVVLTVPAGAVEAEVELFMAPPTTALPLPDIGRAVGPEVEFGPEVVALSAAATITVPFDSGRVSEAESRFVKIWRLSDGAWILTEPSAEPADGLVSAEVTTISRFGAGVLVAE